MNGEKKGRYWKFAVVFVAIVVLALGVFVATRAYERWRGERAVENLAEAMKKAAADDYARAMADTYGGKTPQETLRMYIDAVEKGDYVLASKYFIGANQEKELKRFTEVPSSITTEKLKSYTNTLRSVLSRSGRYDSKNQYFSFDDDILVNMKLYPNGIWKIIEI